MRISAFLAVVLPIVSRAEFIPFEDTDAPFSGPVVKIVESSSDELIVEVHVQGVYALPVLVGQKEMSLWTLESSTRTPGHPGLPIIARLIRLNGPGVTVETKVERVLVLRNVMLAPAPKQPKRCGGGKWRWWCDERIYSTPRVYPSSWASVEPIGSFAGQDIGRLVISPVRYNPVSKEAFVAPHIRIKVKLGDGRYNKTDLGAVAHAALLNDATQDMAQIPERILVIAADALAPYVQPLVDHRLEQGFFVKLVLLSQVGDKAEDVKAFIKKVWQSDERPSYVVLVGDSTLMPYMKGDDGCASDWMYAQLDGDDLLADIMISRISAKKPEDVIKQVQKVLSYEKGLLPDTTWFSSATLVSSSEGEGESNDDFRCDIMAAMFEAAGYAPVDRLYHSKGTDKLTSILSSLNAGRGFIAYLGHGTGTSWTTTNPPLSVEDVTSLGNTGKPPVVMDVSCLNGQFDGFLDCLAEAWMKAGSDDAPAGALATYSSSSDTVWDQPAELAIGAVEGLLMKGLHRWGESTLYAQMHLLAKMGADQDTRLVLQQYVVFGDGVVSVRTRPPKDLLVEVMDTVPVGKFPLTVRVKDENGPVQKALVALRKKNEFSASLYTDKNGEAAFYLDTTTPGEMRLTVTAADSRPFYKTIKVEVTGCGVLVAYPTLSSCSNTVRLSLWDRDLDTPGIDDCAFVLASLESKTLADLMLCQDSGAEFFTEINVSDFEPADKAFINFSYMDADCDGTPRTVTASVALDCEAPKILEAKVHEVTATSAKVSIVTDEPAWITLYYGQDTEDTQQIVSSALSLSHELQLKGLMPSTKYGLTIEASDAVGNAFVAGGITFETLPCSPLCDGRSCGDDGCGGVCGECELDQVCIDGICMLGKGCVVKDTPGWPGAKCEACVCAKDEYCCKWGKWDELCVSLCLECGGCGSKPLCTECGSNVNEGLCWSCGNAVLHEKGKCIATETDAKDAKADSSTEDRVQGDECTSVLESVSEGSFEDATVSVSSASCSSGRAASADMLALLILMLVLRRTRDMRGEFF